MDVTQLMVIFIPPDKVFGMSGQEKFKELLKKNIFSNIT